MALTMKQARVGADMSQQEIAERLGVHKQTYMRYEKNPENMTLKMAKSFASIVGLKVSDIFVFDESTDNRQGGDK